jgi:hypothetical protein
MKNSAAEQRRFHRLRLEGMTALAANRRLPPREQGQQTYRKSANRDPNYPGRIAGLLNQFVALRAAHLCHKHSFSERLIDKTNLTIVEK